MFGKKIGEGSVLQELYIPLCNSYSKMIVLPGMADSDSVNI